MRIYVLIGFILACIQVVAGLINSASGETVGKRYMAVAHVILNGGLGLWAAYLLWL